MNKKITSLHDIYSFEQKTSCPLPVFSDPIQAGFPSVAEQYTSATLDLNDLLITHPAATFFVRVKGESMINAGIRSGDLVIVDRSLAVAHNKIIIARIDTELTIKRFCYQAGNIVLQAENEAYKSISITPESDFEVWGVVTYVIHKVY